MRMTRIRVQQLTPRPVDNAVERGDEHLCCRQLVADSREECVQRLSWVGGRLRMNGRGAHR